jgi:hypothetical protein
MMIDDRGLMIFINGAPGAPISIFNQQSSIITHQSFP